HAVGDACPRVTSLVLLAGRYDVERDWTAFGERARQRLSVERRHGGIAHDGIVMRRRGLGDRARALVAQPRGHRHAAAARVELARARATGLGGYRHATRSPRPRRPACWRVERG